VKEILFPPTLPTKRIRFSCGPACFGVWPRLSRDDGNPHARMRGNEARGTCQRLLDPVSQPGGTSDLQAGWAGLDNITANHVLEAIQYRTLDRTLPT